MNSLFLVSSFLMIFTFFSLTLFKDSRIFSKEKNSICSFIANKQHLQNKWEAYKYLNFKPKNKASPTPKPETPPPKNKTTTAYISLRLKSILPSVSKWNLSPLISIKNPPPYLQKATILLLEELYGHTSFWKEALIQTPNLGERLLSSLLEKNAEKEKPESLSDLFPEDPSLQPLFYKMLKGSTVYNSNEKTGYPPLEDFFCLEPKNTKTLYFSYASYPALKAFFGNAIAEEIFSLEKEKKETRRTTLPSLTKQELAELNAIKGLPISLQDLSLYFDFSRNKKQLDKLSQTGKEQVSLKIPLPSNKEIKQ